MLIVCQEVTHAGVNMDEAKVLVSHHISLHNSAIALEQCPFLEDFDPTILLTFVKYSVSGLVT